MPVPEAILRLLAERLREKMDVLTLPSSEDVLARLRASLAAKTEAPPAEDAPRVITYYGGVIKLAARPAFRTAMGASFKRLRELWRGKSWGALPAQKTT